jgi:hypothetical protein
VRKGRVDMGPNINALGRDRNEEEQYGASTADTTLMKGNIDLQKNVFTTYHNKSKIKYLRSGSLAKRKVVKSTAIEDMGILLPEAEQRRAKFASSVAQDGKAY